MVFMSEPLAERDSSCRATTGGLFLLHLSPLRGFVDLVVFMFLGLKPRGYRMSLLRNFTASAPIPACSFIN